MPFIHIKSLPLENIDVGKVLKRVSEEFSNQTGIGIEHVTATWEYSDPEYYFSGANLSEDAAKDSRPLLVDLLVPDFNKQDVVENMLQSVAKSLAEHLSLPLDNIFINLRYAHSGCIFYKSNIVRW